MAGGSDGFETPRAPLYFRIRIGRITGHRATEE